MKKLMSLFAVLLLVSACETGMDDGSDGSYGGAGNMGPAKPGTTRDFVENVGDRVFFALDSSTLTAEGRATLDKQAVWLKKYDDTNVQIEGHCDERGSREYNLALGERRAVAARNYLTAAGIDGSRVSTISYGKERPAVVGSTEAAYSQNRRAVTVVTQ
ncbi:MAG: peptidoglycan-associated lipoprotein Pal [Bdellovibrionales bacterium]